MQLRYIYKEDINRNINGVIKADQDDLENLRQEFKEYIITSELRKHFSNFFDAYEKSIDTPTDNIGVWISGFFGSGKSHFLKIMSYLLSNCDIDGKKAVDYFEDKIDDPMMFAQLKKCVSVPTDSILFNIDVKSSIKKDKTAILRVFAKVFYEYRGFFGANLKVAKFEKFLDQQGKLEAFKTRFAEINGDTWENSRDSFDFWGDDITQAFTDVTGISKETAYNWFNGTEDSSISIDTFVAELKEYIDSKGKDFRLIFCVDEIGQYMGDDSNLILNLQSIVEEIGTKCAGRVWVLVTSQEAIDEVTKVKSSDYSKIQGRFKTRLSLTSSSVDEVIKKRILAKNEDATDLLGMKYDENASVLKNLITLTDSRADLKGYSSPQEYIETYPFIPYQFNLFQNTLIEIRTHNNAGQHQSSGERSMLSGFQEVAQKLNDKDENALVPYYLFYDTVNTFLESTIRQVIDRCQRAAEAGDGIEAYDVNVLKLLYLIRYINDIPSNIDNIATLMADNIQVDKIDLRNKVKESLERLISQNYIAKNGNTYQFLTDDEQDIAREIRDTMIEPARVKDSIASIIFDDLFMSKNLRFNENIIPYDQYVDEMVHGSPTKNTDVIKLRIITNDSDLADSAEGMLIMKSQADNEAICVLSDEYDYFDELNQALKIRKYAKIKNSPQLPENIRRILDSKQSQATELEKEAKFLVEKAILDGTFYVYGQKIVVSGANVKDKLNNALKALVDAVYSKLSYIRKNYQSDADILKLFNDDQISFGTGSANSDAVNEVSTWLNAQAARHFTTSMADVQKRYSGIPYGWREIDIAAVVAELIVEKQVNIRYGGAVVTERNGHLVDLLRKKSEIDKTIVERREKPDKKLIREVTDFLQEYLDIMDVPSDEDELIEFIENALNEKLTQYRNLITKYTLGIEYPGKGIVMKASSDIEDVLKYKKDSRAFLKRLVEKQDDLLDDVEDIEDVVRFFETQKATYDKGLKLLSTMKDEEVYLSSISEATEALDKVKAIIFSDKPYGKISEIPTHIHNIGEVYEKLLSAKKQELTEYLEDASKEIVDAAMGDVDMQPVKSANTSIMMSRNKISSATSLLGLDAMKSHIDNTKNTAIKAIFDEQARREAERLAAQNQPEGEGEIDVPVVPETKVATISKSSLAPAIRLKSEEEVEQYVELIRKSLLKKLEDNDYIQII